MARRYARAHNAFYEDLDKIVAAHIKRYAHHPVTKLVRGTKHNVFHARACLNGCAYALTKDCIEEVWRDCPRVDWLQWMSARMAIIGLEMHRGQWNFVNRKLEEHLSESASVARLKLAKWIPWFFNDETIWKIK